MEKIDGPVPNSSRNRVDRLALTHVLRYLNPVKGLIASGINQVWLADVTVRAGMAVRLQAILDGQNTLADVLDPLACLI